MSPNQSEPRQRLFFALWPDAAVRSGLAQTSQELLGKKIRRVPETNLHITLAFAGPVTAAVRQCLEQQAAGIRAAPFELTLERIGHWPRPRILWAGPAHTPPELWSLVGGLNSAFEACGLAHETRPWQAHVTLARKISRAPQATVIEPIHWSISDFCLVESVTGAPGASYRILASWKLEGE
jgi:2'-5' RNA ligase